MLAFRTKAPLRFARRYSSVSIPANKINYKIGKVLLIELHPDADQLYVLQVNLGGPEPIQICSGLRQHIPMEEIVDKCVVVVNNIKKSKMRGLESHAMLLAAADQNTVELVNPPKNGSEGEDMMFLKDGEEFESLEYLKIKSPSKLKECLENIKTDSQGRVVYGESVLRNKNGEAWVAKLFGADVR